MRTLVIYYSLAGNSRTVATALAQEMSADLEEIHCDRYRMGFTGFIKAGYDSWAGRLPAIAAPVRSPSTYDLVVIGGPMWAMHAATPVRAYVQRFAGQLPAAAFFLTCGGAPTANALGELERLAGSAAQAMLTVTDADLKSGGFRSAVSRFAATLRQRKAA